MIRNEYPRPQFQRDNWQNLNGEWLFTFDDDNRGLEEKWYEKRDAFNLSINVPFVYQSERSGINLREPHDIVWYYKEIELTKLCGEHAILHFGAVDYEADVYVNGQHIKHHIGGHTSFSVDITAALVSEKKQVISLRVYDPQKDESIPRGKQFWEKESAGIWYTNSTGIWQTVWIETVPENHLTTLFITPLFDDGKVQIETEISNIDEYSVLEYEIRFKGQLIVEGQQTYFENKLSFEVDLYQEYIFRTNYHNNGWSWTPEEPNLFELELRLKTRKSMDRVQSYFGLRKIHTENGMIYLNNKPYYQKLVLDQGYWPDGLLTAPEDQDFVKDIELSKLMGFNGCRKHQKIEDPRFLYWADKLGFLVWGECAAPTIYNRDSVERLMNEWADILKRDYNHPSIVTWVPINESWGVPNISFDRQQQHFSQMMYHFLHSIDKTRLVISNDGWAMTETDIIAIHNYAHGFEDEIIKYNYFKETLSNRNNLISKPSTPWPILANGFDYKNQPILLTEFGGIGFDVSGQPGWGYTSVSNEKEFVKDYKRIMDALYASTGLFGYCYTQLTDVEQEINGLLTYDRQPKCDLSEIKRINDGNYLSVVE